MKVYVSKQEFYNGVKSMLKEHSKNTRKFMKHSYYGLIKKVGKIICENEGA